MTAILTLLNYSGMTNIKIVIFLVHEMQFVKLKGGYLTY